ncbi:response regulator [Poseidonocella sp. HB161398]|uniref:response regulator n=1 Tax=Poseidonocella sp. HB161398 TaxID=2320855 RepID=UPI001109A297|nr:response regulator [Poseidonocella sp. HB161398]
MHVLIVESDAELGQLWQRHLERSGKQVTLVGSQDAALAALSCRSFSILVLDAVLEEGSAFAVADVAGYRWPGMKIVFVTRQSFFSDGSIFRHAANACAMLRHDTAPDDLDAVLDHYGAA